MASLKQHPATQQALLPSTIKGRFLKQNQIRCKILASQTQASTESRTESSTYLSAAAAPVLKSGTVSKPPLQKTGANPFKNWIDESLAFEDQKLVAKLRLLQASISERKEMHSIIGQQRDNWNKLFQGSLRLATISAALLAAFSGAINPKSSSSLAISAGVLNVVASLIIIAVNKFQPSQLAEEQRTAVKLFGSLYQEIETTLEISPTLREDSSSFFQDLTSKFYALDQAYPLPLTPGGLPKFPAEIRPSPSGITYQTSAPIIRVEDHSQSVNGWTQQIEEDLLRISTFVAKDIANYLNMCKVILLANKALAIAAPAMGFMAGVANFGNCCHLSAALLSIGAFFAGSLSHDMQLGMVFEMYRNCAGYYVDVDATIQRTLRMPVELREDGELFHQKIVHKLGRRDEFPSIPPGAEAAGILF